MGISKYYKVYGIEDATLVEDYNSGSETYDYATIDIIREPYWATGLYETEEDAIKDLDRYVEQYDNRCFVVLPAYVKAGIYD